MRELNNSLSKMERPGEDARHRNSDLEMQKDLSIGVDRFLASLREIERGLARRPRHRHAVRSRWERAIESILYALTELLLLRGLVTV